MLVQSNVKPADVDTSSKFVYLRSNIQRVVIETEDGSYDCWQYDETKLTHDQYRILQLEQENTNLQLALTELYEQLLEG